MNPAHHDARGRPDRLDSNAGGNRHVAFLLACMTARNFSEVGRSLIKAGACVLRERGRCERAEGCRNESAK